MKILHINSLSSGGAANAAIRLHHGLLKQGLESHFLTLSGEPNQIENHIIFPTFSNYGYSLWNRIKNKLGLTPLKSKKRTKDFKSIQGNIECFSSPHTDFNLGAFINERLDFDIINLHWVSNFLDYQEFFSEVNKPIFWTLHDQNPFSSYWHYSLDNIENEIAQKLHTNYLNIKAESIKNAKAPIHIVTPSKWLVDCSKASVVFKNLNHSHIKYGLDTNIFKPRKEAPTNIPAISEDQEIIKCIFICQSLSNKRKGMPLLLEAVNNLPTNLNIQLIAIGQANESIKASLPKNTIFTGTIQDQNELAKLYSTAEFTLIPSLQDNLPNTMLESLACGTPVIGTPAGGIPEVVERNNYGIIANEISAQALSEAIIHFSENKNHYDRESISNFAHADFNEELQAKSYMDIYKGILSS